MCPCWVAYRTVLGRLEVDTTGGLALVLGTGWVDDDDGMDDTHAVLHDLKSGAEHAGSVFYTQLLPCGGVLMA